MMMLMLGTAVVALSQTMVEYSTLSTHSSGALATSRLSAHAGKYTSDRYGTTKGRVWQEKDARVKDENPSKPAPPAVFILTNGERLESANYVMTTDALRITQQGQQRTISMAELNRSATVAANRERGIDLKFPDNKAQISISF